MKVKIKEYPSYYGPTELVETLFFWVPKEKDEFGLKTKPMWVYNIAEKYSNSWLGNYHRKLAQKVCDRQERKRCNVHIDCWDTWSMDDTLAHIILPMLVQLKQTKHGAPFVDIEDVPENMRPGQLEIDLYNKEGKTDALFFKRWDYILDEMIWSFNEQIKDYDESEGQFYDSTNVSDDMSLEELRKAFTVDEEGLEKYSERKANGFRLFGKYYGALWD